MIRPKNWTCRLLSAVLSVLMLSNGATAYGPVDVQDKAHEIAELAREIGLAEDDPIIEGARKLWWEAHEAFCADRDTLATLIYHEAWGGCSERHRELVAAVVMNRVDSDKYPDTIADVVNQPGQYPAGYADADSYLGRMARENEEAFKTCQGIAERAILGNVDCPKNVLYQACFTQGSVYESHYSGYSTTYFCYG